MIKATIRGLAAAAVLNPLIASSSLVVFVQDALSAPAAVQLPPHRERSPNVQYVADDLVSSPGSTRPTKRDNIGRVPESTTTSTGKNLDRSTARATTAELVVYESKDCAVSRRFRHEMAADYKTSKGGRVFPLRRADIANGPAGIRLAQPITMTPTFVFVDQGEEIGRFTGYPGREHFLKLLNAAADEFAKIKAAE